MTSVNNTVWINKQTNKHLWGVQQILHLSCEYNSDIEWPVLGYCLTEHQQNNNCCNYLQANEKMFFSVVEWPTREAIMWLLTLLSFSSLFLFLPSYLELRPTSLCEPSAQIALLASSSQTQSLMSCASSPLIKEMTAGVITEIWDLTKL